MTKALLNSDMLNDNSSIYFPINDFEFYKFPINNDDLVSAIISSIGELEDKGYNLDTVFVPLVAYNNANVKHIPDFDLNIIDFKDELNALGVKELKYIVMIPDVLKDKCAPAK